MFEDGEVELEINTFCRVANFCPFPLILMVIWCGRLYCSAEEEYARNGYSWRFISRVRCNRGGDGGGNFFRVAVICPFPLFFSGDMSRWTVAYRQRRVCVS